MTGQALLAGLAGACLVAGVLLGAFGAFHRTGPVLPTRTAPRDLRWLRRHGITPSRAAAALVAGVVTLVVTDWPVAALGAAAGTAFVPPLLRPRSARCLIDRLDALATWTRRIADTLGAGAGGLEHAIAASARTAPSALRSELTTLAAAARIQGVEPALRSLADTLDDPAADRVVAALILRTRAGGRGLVEILDGLAASLREEALARRQVEADRAKPRSNMRSIVLITVMVLGGLLLFAREYLAPFTGVQGQLVLSLVLLIFTAAFWWMHQLSQTPVTGRLLRAGRPGHRQPHRGGGAS